MNPSNSHRTRIAVIRYDDCHPEKCNWACEKACPVNRAGKECITEREDVKQPKISEELCIGCKICVPACPFGAISIVNLEAKLDFPIHEYGVNGFRIYSLPMPKRGSVVGLVGRNGIGKSTALGLLSGKIDPNFAGKKEDIITVFKGTELQLYFEELIKEKILISYKPQNVDLLPKVFSGTVKQMLEEVNENNRLEELIEKMNLSSLLEKKLTEISGGELQRLAIAAALLKEADLYFFDEPTTYLDVRERLKAAAEIRNLCENNKMVVVVEHDLAILDYLSDYSHVLFGEKAVYGVVSERKASRNGINEYLEGYLKNENIRFRDKPVNFTVLNPDISKKRVNLIDYPAMQKKLGSFSLNAQSGTIKEGEIIGVLGANATGKTTFVKMLAGGLDPDNEKFEKLKISYKPQYIATDSEQTLMQAFAENKAMDLLKSPFAVRLGLSKLAERKLCELSGGELQKVAVTLCLSRDADLYLLDEPTAFVDIEDRLAMAQFIREIIEKKEKAAIVVDHDLLFQDFISDRVVVFSGEPGIKTIASKPVQLQDAMNQFLKDLNITFRRDPTNGRPRANKLGSQKDLEQKKANTYYHAKH